MKLEHTHEVTERRKNGLTIDSKMTIRVDYDHKEDSISDVEVFITQYGVTMEISKLLDKAEGDPLCVMIEAIDWQQLAAEQMADIADIKANEYYDKMIERRAEV